jgi:hypothetical protein
MRTEPPAGNLKRFRWFAAGAVAFTLLVLAMHRLVRT